MTTTTTPKITNRIILQMAGALDALAALEMKAERSFQLSGKIRLCLVRNIRVLKAHAADLQNVKDALIRAHGNGDTITPKSAGWLVFLDEWEKVLSTETDMVLEMITIEDLNLEVNQIPLAILENLQPVFEVEPGL